MSWHELKNIKLVDKDFRSGQHSPDGFFYKPKSYEWGDFPVRMCGSTVFVDDWRLIIIGGGTGRVYATLDKSAEVWAVLSENVGFDSQHRPRYLLIFFCYCI